MGAGGGSQELLRELEPRLDAPLCRTSDRRPASDQPDSALAESKRSGRWETPRERGRHPQGGSISVMLSNVYLHYALDLWFERVVKPQLRGEAYLVRYIDDFVLCFQYRAD